MAPDQRKLNPLRVTLAVAVAGCSPGASPNRDLPTPADRLALVEPGPVRFVVLGDGGKGNATQRAVAEGIATVCAARRDDRGPGCRFALYTGDNIYDSGVEGPDDPQFAVKFEEPYADLDVPFFMVLGNHDYGSTSLAGWRGDPQVAYSGRSAKWTLPQSHYAFDVSGVRFLALDTNAIMLEDIWGDSGQGAWVDRQLSGPRRQWRIAFGHHPYRSNGQHGNAGDYEGLGWLPVVRGATLEAFFEAHLCARVDIYFSGHDHNRQWLSPTCRTEWVVSGAAAGTSALVERNGTPAEWQDDQTPGFLWVEVDGDRLTGTFHDLDGTERYTRVVLRSGSGAAPGPSPLDASHSGMRRSSQ